VESTTRQAAKWPPASFQLTQVSSAYLLATYQSDWNACEPQPASKTYAANNHLSVAICEVQGSTNTQKDECSQWTEFDSSVCALQFSANATAAVAPRMHRLAHLPAMFRPNRTLLEDDAAGALALTVDDSAIPQVCSSRSSGSCRLPNARWWGASDFLGPS
jgi:hypothetical protein